MTDLAPQSLALWAVALAAACTYPALRQPSALATAVKTGPALCLAALALGSGQGALACALVACAVGDAALSRPGSLWFLAGMGAFALAHLAFALWFAALGAAPDALRLSPALLLVVFAVLMGLRFVPRAGALAWPVAGYVVVIAAMALTALALPPGAAVLIWPALLFVLSDALIGEERFRARPHLGLPIWITYVAALAGFVLAGVHLAVPA